MYIMGFLIIIIVQSNCIGFGMDCSRKLKLSRPI